MLKVIILVGLIAAGYWYYTGPYQDQKQSPEYQAQQNARMINDCMREEARMAAGAGLAGVMSDSGDVQTVCADKLGLELREGRWQLRRE